MTADVAARHPPYDHIGISGCRVDGAQRHPPTQWRHPPYGPAKPYDPAKVALSSTRLRIGARQVKPSQT
jgi:hypothetical protein